MYFLFYLCFSQKNVSQRQNKKETIKGNIQKRELESASYLTKIKKKMSKKKALFKCAEISKYQHSTQEIKLTCIH